MMMNLRMSIIALEPLIRREEIMVDKRIKLFLEITFFQNHLL